MPHSPKKFLVRYTANFLSTNKNFVKIWVSQPLNSVTQKINHFKISETPKKIYKDTQGNKILYFEFRDTKNSNLQIDFDVTLWKNSFQMKNEKNILPSNSSKIFERYTKSEQFLEQEMAIKELAKKLENKNDVYKNVQAIFNFIKQNFTYCYPIKNRGVKNLQLSQLKGDCAEYSSLFVTLCRILKIPARNVTGFVVYPKQKKIMEHAWASVYFRKFGWLDFDTQYASLVKNSSEYFGKRMDYRIAFVNGFNIPLEPTIPSNFQTEYWKDIGLPITKNSVQTLQPIVFASKDTLVFKDTIELL